MAKKSSKYRHFSVMATEGGQLVAGSNSEDTAGAANYTEKVNFRRETDGEVRREGWERLKLDEYVDNLGTDDPVRLVYQFLSDEELVIVAASGDKIYRLNESTETWVVIAEGLQYIDSATHVVEPRRWEVLSIDGYCIFNNGADLPLIYRNGWSCAYPIYGIRERGIVRCGTITEFDGRLWLADMTYIDEDSDPDAFTDWMQNATEPYGLPENESFSTPTYNSPHSIEYSAWRLADNISVAKASPYLFGQVYNGEVSVMNGSTLAEIKLPYELGGANTSNSLNPYHASTSIEAGTIKIGDSIRMSIDTTPGQTTPNYVVYDGVVSSMTLVGGETKIALTTPAANPGALTASGDDQSSVSVPEVGEPLQLILLKEPDTFSQDADLQKESADGLSFPEDGSQILKMVKLADKLLVYRQTGYLAISRGNTQSAYFFEEKYRGERVADFRNTIITIDSQRQLFAGYNGVFIVTPAAVEPTPFQPHMMGPEFWRNITRQEIEYCWACENSLTQEIFIIAPVGIKLDDSTGMKLDWGVIAYDMIYGTLSQIDAAMTSACNLFPTPKISSRWFILSTHVVENENDMYTDSELLREEDKEFTSAGSKIMRYSYGPAVENIFGNTQPYRSFRRDGADYISRIKYGKNDFGDKFSEKMLRSYALHLSDRYDYTTYTRDGYVEDEFTKDLSATVSINTYSTGVDKGDEEINEVLDSLDTETMVPLFAQGNYYQDTIELRGRDNGFKILGRTFEVSGVRTRHTNEAHEVSA
jgi:hypothetical protein